MKTIKLELFPMKSTNEIFQSLDIKFSFVNSDYKQVSNPIKCRDFLGDVLFSRKIGKSVSIYGFNYNFQTNPYDTKKTRISMKFPNKESFDYLVANIHKLNELETSFGLTKTKLMTTQDKQTLVVVGSNVWQSAPWKISLYTFLLKMYSYTDENSLESPEDGYYEVLKGNLSKLMSKIKVRKVMWYDDVGWTHNYSGFVSVIKGHSNMSNLLGFKKK